MSIALFAEFQETHAIINPADKDRIEKFLKHVMIENRAVYTLLGSKPMTAFPISPFIDEEEKQAMYNAQTDKFKKYISLKKFTPSKLDCRQLWEDWKKVENKYLGKQFLFVEFEKWEAGIFVNIPAAAFVFKKYYEEFAKITGQKFDPYTAAYKIGNSSDLFWGKVEKNHYLLGLLLGFGEKNSQYFQWESEKGVVYLRTVAVNDQAPDKNPRTLNIEDLNIPTFITYSLIDDQIEKNKTEREKIIKLYKDKDFTEFTLRILKGTNQRNFNLFELNSFVPRKTQS